MYRDVWRTPASRNRPSTPAWLDSAVDRNAVTTAAPRADQPWTFAAGFRPACALNSTQKSVLPPVTKRADSSGWIVSAGAGSVAAPAGDGAVIPARTSTTASTISAVWRNPLNSHSRLDGSPAEEVS